MPLKLVICSWATGIGAGAARIEAYCYRLFNRELIEPRLVYLRDPGSASEQYDPSIEFEYIGAEDRLNALLEVIADADIVQFQGSFDPLVCEAARISRLPVLIEVLHNIEPGGLFSNIDLSVCVSKAVFQAQADKQKAKVILNGIDLAEFPFREEPRSADRIVLLQVGSRDKPVFNLDELAEDILSLDPRIEIWLSGRGQQGESSERVKLLGVMRDIESRYREADAMVLLSGMEPFGLVALEAMASGCIPVVSDSGGFSEIVTHGVDGLLVSQKGREQVCEAIREVVRLRDSEKWEEMRKAARETVDSRFSIERCVREYEKIYLDLSSEKGPRKQPGVRTSSGSCEADVGDALYCFHERNWERLAVLIARLSDRGEALEHRLCIRAAMDLGGILAANNHTNVAKRLFEKLYNSGLTELALLRHWLSCFNEEAPPEVLKTAILKHASTEADLVLSLADKLLRGNKAEESWLMLCEAVAQCPQTSVELRELYTEWADKIRIAIGIG